MMPSVLILGINYSPEPTGIGKYTGELGSFLSNAGMEVRVVTGFPYYPHWKIREGYKSNWFRHEVIDGANLVRCPLYVPKNPTGATRMLQDLSFFVTSFMAVTGLIFRRKKFDVTFVASPSFMSGLVGYWYKLWNKNTMFVYHIQDLQIDAAEELGMVKNNFVLKVLKRTEQLILRNADTVSTISLGMKKRIIRKGVAVKKMLIFPNWVNYEYIFKTKPDLGLLAHLGIPLGKKLVFYSGAVGEKQGLGVILSAAEKAAREWPQLHFVVSGTGPYAQCLSKQAEVAKLKNISFIPLQPLPVFNHLLNATWLHLVVQKGKAGDLLLPSKLTNILAVGGLVLVTADPGTSLHEIIHYNEIGYLVPPENADKFYEAICYLAANEEVEAKMKLAAAYYAEQYLDQSNVIVSFLSELGYQINNFVVSKEKTATV